MAETDLLTDAIQDQPQIYDPYDYALHDDPYPVYKRLRDEFPLYYNHKHDFYAVSRYDDCMAVLRNFKTFINAKSTTLEKNVIPGVLPFMLFRDPPEHTRLRRLMADQFRPQNVAPLESIVRDMARRLLAPHAATGSIDVIADFAAKLPMAIICRLMGVRPEDEDMLRGWTDDIVHREDGSSEILEVNITGTQQLLGYFEAMMQERIAADAIGEDFVGQLIAGRTRGQARSCRGAGLSLPDLDRRQRDHHQADRQLHLPAVGRAGRARAGDRRPHALCRRGGGDAADRRADTDAGTRDKRRFRAPRPCHPRRLEDGDHPDRGQSRRAPLRRSRPLSASIAAPRIISASAAGCTAASARRLPGSKAGSRWRKCST